MNMKAILILSLLFATSLFGVEFNNGAIYSDRSATIISTQGNGVVTTNVIGAGRTILTEKTIVELTTKEKTVLHLGGVALLQVGKDSQFAITLFDETITNLNDPPRKAEIGEYTLNMEFTSGEFAIIYPNKDTNFSVTVTTPLATYELKGGKYYFKVGKSTMVFCLEGGLVVHGDRNSANVVEKGSLAIAVPFSDPSSGIDDKIVTSFKRAKMEENEKFAAPILEVEKHWADVGFFVIDGKILGIKLK